MIKAKFLLALSLMVSSVSFASAAQPAQDLGCSGAQPYKKICQKYEAYVFPSNDLTTFLLNSHQRGAAAQIEKPARIAYNILLQIRKQAGKHWVYQQNQAMKKAFTVAEKSKTLKAIFAKNKKAKALFGKVSDEFYAYSHILEHYTDDEEDDIEDHDDVEHDDTDDASEEDDSDDSDQDDSSEEDDSDDSSDEEEDDSDDIESDDSDDSSEEEEDDSDDSSEEDEDDFEHDDL